MCIEITLHLIDMYNHLAVSKIPQMKNVQGDRNDNYPHYMNISNYHPQSKHTIKIIS